VPIIRKPYDEDSLLSSIGKLVGKKVEA